MATYYHFTGEDGLRGIQSSGQIFLGKSPFCSKARFVCLTDSPDPEGHGLPQGFLVPKKSANFVGLAKKTNAPAEADHIIMANLRKYRLSIEIPQGDPALFHWDDLVKKMLQNDLSFDAMPRNLSDAEKQIAFSEFIFSALHPGGYDHLTNIEIVSAVALISNKMVEGTKEDTWWFYEGEIDKSRITKIERELEKKDGYEPYALARTS